MTILLFLVLSCCFSWSQFKPWLPPLPRRDRADGNISSHFGHNQGIMPAFFDYNGGASALYQLKPMFAGVPYMTSHNI